MYYKGKGVPSNINKAFEYFLKASVKQNADGAYQLANLIEK